MKYIKLLEQYTESLLDDFASIGASPETHLKEFANWLDLVDRQSAQTHAQANGVDQAQADSAVCRICGVRELPSSHCPVCGTNRIVKQVS